MSATLLPGQQVTLTLEGHGVRTATVDAVDGREVTLAPTGSERWPGELAELDAAIEFTTPVGLHRAAGSARRGRGGSVRLLLAGDLERIQRREWARAETTRPAQLRKLGTGGGAVVETWTLDLSAGGARLSGAPGELQVGDRIELRIRLDESSELVVAAEVARATADGHVGVRIADIAEIDRERIVRFVFEQQRRALRVRER